VEADRAAGHGDEAEGGGVVVQPLQGDAGRGWRGRSLSAVGNGRSRELCAALELAPTTVQAASLALLHQQPQQASCRHDQDDKDPPNDCIL
jgi:hypothetical protein